MRALLLILCLCLLASPAFAQSQATSGQLTGRVVDSSGGVLPGATVTISNPATGFSREVTANSEGIYTAPLLPTGTYEITAELSGFQSTKATGIKVTVGSIITVNLTLQVAGVSETVSVTSAASPVETTSTSPSSTLDSAAIANLPINGRRFQDFVTLTPNAQVDPQRGQISLSGQRGINTNVNIDGVDYNQPFFGGIRGGERSNFAFTIPQESIQEFQVVAAGYSAEFGRSSGGIVNAVTKSGTNAMHGTAFYVNRNEKLAKKNVFGQKGVPTQQQFGGSFGGPIRKDKAFYFGAYEQQELNQERAVQFDNLTQFTRTADVGEAFDFYKSLETPYTQTNDALAALARLDYQVTSANRFNIRYSGSKNEAKNGTSVGNVLLPTVLSALSNNGTEKDRTNTVVGQYTSILGPRLLLEVRGQYSKEVRPRTANDKSPTVGNAIGTFGTVSFLGENLQFDWRGQGAANLTWISGGHTAKFGAEFTHTFIDQTFGFNQYGVFSFTTTATATLLDILSVGGTIANRFDSTNVNYDRQIGNLRLAFATNEAAIFAQDAWRIRPNLTLTYGIRWEGNANPTPESNNESMLARVRGVTFPTGRQIDPTQIPDIQDQIGPRVGFAWDPFNDAKTVVRGYGGIYYARSPALLFAGPMNNFRIPPGDLSIRLPRAVPAGNPNNTVYRQLLLIGIDLNTYPLGKLPILTPEQVQAVAQALGLGLDPFGGATPLLVDQNFKNPESYQFGFGVERELAVGLTAGVEYSHVKTTHLQRNYDVNLPAPTIRATDPAQRPFFGVTSGVARPVPTLGRIWVRESTARSLFRALTVRTRLQRSWGQANVFYTLGKSLSDDDNERDATGVRYENGYNLAPEYNYSNLDRRHQFNGGVVFYLPYGFDVSSGFALRSAVPVDPGMGSDVNQDQGGSDRPYHAPGQPFRRNEFRNRPQYDVSLRVQKGFNFASQQRLVLSVEFFNVFNVDNIQYSGTAVTNYCATTTQADCGFGAPTNVNFLQIIDRNPNSPRVGQYLLNNNPGPPLQVQLGVRYQF